VQRWGKKAVYGWALPNSASSVPWKPKAVESLNRGFAENQQGAAKLSSHRPSKHQERKGRAYWKIDLPAGQAAGNQCKRNENGLIQKHTSKKETKMNKLIKFFKDEEGLELVEYAVMLALIVIGIVVTITLLGNAVNSKFSEAASAVENT